MEHTISMHGLSFEPYLSEAAIRLRIAELGKQISTDYLEQPPLFIAVLNGAFIFAADLLRACPIDCEITFIRLSSYEGTRSSGQVKSIVGLKEEIKGRDVIIVEDIVDTGKTMTELLAQLEEKQPASIKIATLLDKKEARTHEVDIHYTGFEIPNKFVVGYGLDYDGLGRNLPEIYKAKSAD
jgi:hypoxanthine phosphoribosyltransferase